MSNLIVLPDNEIVKTPQSNLSELTAQFIASLDVKPTSRATYTRQISYFVNWLVATDRAQHMGQLSRIDILAYKEYLKNKAGEAGQGLSVYGSNGQLTVVRKFYAWLESEKIYPDIAKSVKGYKPPRGHSKDTLNAQQLRSALDGIETDSSLSELDRLRNFAMFNLMARTGLRDIEVSRATVGDMRTEQGSPVLYVWGKGRDSADEFVLLTPESHEPIKAYLKLRGQLQQSAALFASSSRRNFGQPMSPRSVSRIIKNALVASGLDDPRITAHSLRHTAVTLAILAGAKLEQAQAMARHASPATTMGYFHNLNRISQGAERLISF